MGTSLRFGQKEIISVLGRISHDTFIKLVIISAQAKRFFSGSYSDSLLGLI
jgi:hypothetical protein